jgi:hypothetical protein
MERFPWMVQMEAIEVSHFAYSPFQPPLAYVGKPKALVAMEVYLVAITTRISVNKMSR